MGRKLTPTEEVTALRDLIRQAHEVTQGLNAAVKEAKSLAPDLTRKFEQHCDMEIKDLSNKMVIDSNRAAANLNANIEEARRMITEQIMQGEAIFDATQGVVRISFGAMRFDDAQPLPYPEVTSRKDTP